ncbi:AMP-binding protein [Salinibacillus xinjiangensis]|uniref:AMP-binding protein n=2 Tax=Salinibacillus xinjiangensis TaxID=1229268 RepID=A0A6G1X592_9BACI|nr:AMP-binding protein [Salinibacillus xinjiangensis]
MILADKKQIEDYTAKGYWGTKTLIDWFKEHVSKHPERMAVVDPLNRKFLTGHASERLTFPELDRAVDATATALIQKGLEKDDTVIVQLPNTWELAMLYLAIARAGGLISPVPLQWRQKDVEYVTSLTEAKFCITVEDFHGFKHAEMMREIMLNTTIQEVFTLERLRKMTEGPVDNQALSQVQIDANDIFTLCWTSGTESNPKGCPLSHNNWQFIVKFELEIADIREGDVLLTAGPLINMASVATTYIPWIMTGGTYVLHHPFDPQVFIQQMMQEKVNYTLLVPAIANMIVKHPQVDQFDLSQVRAITLGSAPPSLFSIQEFKRRWNIEIGNIWGQNEGTGIVSGPKEIADLEKRVDHLPQYGKPGVKWGVNADGIETKLVSVETGEEVTEVGEVGELAYKSPSVIAGYFKRDDLNAKAFDDEGYFYTGDLFVIKEDHMIGFFDRKKDIVIRGGYNISAQEVENSLLGHPKIADVAAVGLPDEVLGEKVCVYVVPQKDQTVTLEELNDFLKEMGMAVYKLPERLEVVNQIPRNPVGKILKASLREDLKQRMGVK